MTNQLPDHIGFILDGNRRWAKSNGKTAIQGHLAGYNNFYKVGLYLLTKKKIPFVSAYVFSTENWDRSKPEVKFLMKLVRRALDDFLDEFHKEGIRILIVGNRDKLDKKVLDAIKTAEHKTKQNKNGTLALCFNYGGQQEIVDAVKGMLEDRVNPDAITPALVDQYVYHPELPEVDLIIRTSNEQRLSGFMMWRSSYSELYFSSKYWPDFTIEDTNKALLDYQNRQRRYGK